MPIHTASKIIDFFRAWPLAAVATALLLVVLVADLARIDLLIWGVTKVAVLAYAGYWIDRWLFPYARPHDWWWDETPTELGVEVEPLSADELEQFTSLQPVIVPALQLRRAAIVAACILVAALIP